MYSPKHYTHVLLPIKTFLTRVVYEFRVGGGGITNRRCESPRWLCCDNGAVLLVLMMRCCSLCSNDDHMARTPRQRMIAGMRLRTHETQLYNG